MEINKGETYTYSSEYGNVRVIAVGIDNDLVEVSLAEDFPPLGNEGESSWVPEELLFD